MIPVTTPVIRQEVESAQAILASWFERIDAGIPGLDIPADEMACDLWIHQFCGELLVVAGKCENLASILAGERLR